MRKYVFYIIALLLTVGFTTLYASTKAITFTHFIVKTTKDGLSSNAINDVYANGSHLYVATDKGLSISTDRGQTFINKTEKDGLGSHEVRNIHVAGNNLYVASRNDQWFRH